ncbi:hypothetical protein HID58_063360, partial [Brassica napus]
GTKTGTGPLKRLFEKLTSNKLIIPFSCCGMEPLKLKQLHTVSNLMWDLSSYGVLIKKQILKPRHAAKLLRDSAVESVVAQIKLVEVS